MPQGNGEKTRDLISKEMRFVGYIAGGLFGAYFMVMSPVNRMHDDVLILQHEVNYIKFNDLKHIEEKVDANRIDIQVIRDAQLKHWETSKDNNDELKAIHELIKRKW